MKAPREYSAPRMALHTSIVLLVFVVVFTGFLAGAYQLTRPAIEASAAAEKMKLISEVLPAGQYDNDLLASPITLPANTSLGQTEPSTAYLAKKQGEAVALVFEAIANDGYSGKIRLLLAVSRSGSVLGVRVLAHKETPGLGDYIEPKKDKNKARPWITQFDGRSLAEPTERGWRVKKDGGVFDANVGATVTPRAVVKAVHRALRFVAEHGDAFFAPSFGTDTAQGDRS